MPPLPAPPDVVPATACPPELVPLVGAPEAPLACPPVPPGAWALSLQATMEKTTKASVGAAYEINLQVVFMGI
jgi:hypothetical protein